MYINLKKISNKGAPCLFCQIDHMTRPFSSSQQRLNTMPVPPFWPREEDYGSTHPSTFICSSLNRNKECLKAYCTIQGTPVQEKWNRGWEKLSSGEKPGADVKCRGWSCSLTSGALSAEITLVKTTSSCSSPHGQEEVLLGCTGDVEGEVQNALPGTQMPTWSALWPRSIQLWALIIMVSRTFHLLPQHFWWPSLKEDTIELTVYVKPLLVLLPVDI